MADLTDLRRRIREDAERRVADAAPRLESELKGNAPQDDGDLIRNTTVRARGLTAEVRIGVDYASYTITGTRPHVIRPRRASALSFFWERVGEQVVFASVNHPGTPPSDWYDRSLERWPRLL